MTDIGWTSQKSILKNFTIILAVSLLGIATIIVVGAYISSTSKANAELKRMANVRFVMLQEILQTPVWNYSQREIEIIGELYFDDEITSTITIGDENGKILFHKEKENESSLFIHQAPITYNGKDIGFVRYSASEVYLSVLKKNFLYSLVATELLILFSTLIISGLALRYFLRKSFLSFSEAVNDFARGNENAFIDKVEYTEFTPIINAMKKMREEITAHSEAVIKSEAQLNAFFAQSPIGMVIYDADGRHVKINETLSKASGISVEAHIGKTIYELLPSDVAADADGVRKKIMETGEAVSWELSGVLPEASNEKQYFLNTFFPIPGPDSKPIGVGGSVVDISEIKKIQKQLEILNIELEKRVLARTQDLAEANEFLNTIFEKSPIGIAIYAEDGQCIRANEILSKQTGGTVSDLEKQNYMEIQPWKKSGMFDAAQTAMQTGSPTTINANITTTFGREASFSCYFAPLVMDEEKHLLMMVADKTAIRKAEDYAINVHKQLMTAIESMEDGFVLFDADDKLVLCNERYKSIYSEISDVLIHGNSFEEIVRAGIKRGLIDLNGVDDEQWIATRVKQHRQGDNVDEQKLSNGRWIRISERPTEDGSVVGLRSDITKIKNYELAVNQFKETLDRTLDSVFMFDPDTLKFTYVNQGAISHLGYDEGKLLAMHPYDIKPEYSENEFKKLTKKIIKNAPHAITFETIHKRKDGGVIPVEIFLQYIASGDGSSRFVAIVRDISDRKELYEQLIQSSKLATLGEMATGVAHELNQPLNVIRMAAQNIKRKVAKNDADNEYLNDKLDKISGQVVRAAAIIDHMRIFGRKSGSEPTHINPVDSVNSVLEMLGEQLRLSGIYVKIDADDNCRKILGHEVQMEQVMLNLLSNARDALLGRGGIDRNITISIADMGAEDKVEIVVCDNGGGIPTESLKRLFEPFYTTKEVGKGTGLGLSISYGIISEMGGEITAENINDGACFTVTVPAVIS